MSTKTNGVATTPNPCAMVITGAIKGAMSGAALVLIPTIFDIFETTLVQPQETFEPTFPTTDYCEPTQFKIYSTCANPYPSPWTIDALSLMLIATLSGAIFSLFETKLKDAYKFRN